MRFFCQNVTNITTFNMLVLGYCIDFRNCGEELKGISILNSIHI